MNPSKRIKIVLGLLGLSGLSACGPQPRMDNQYSELQLHEIVESAEGLQLQLRISNFGEKPFEVERLQFTLAIEGRPAITQTHTLALNVSGWGTEPLSFKAPAGRLGEAAADAQLRYELSGLISRKGFGGEIPVQHVGVLSPVPGVSGAWR